VSYRLPPYTVHFPLSAASIREVDWGVSSYGIPELWKRGEGQGVKVAVIDSGAAHHYALSAVAERKNFSEDESELDEIGHGTHVAGIICGSQPPARGIAPRSEVYALKVLGGDGKCSAESVCDALYYASALGCDIACLSLGSTAKSEKLHKAIRDVNSQGLVVVAAAGNDGGAVNFPAAFLETVAVGAVDRDGEVCPFSSRGEEIVCAAPGQDIQSTWLAGGYATVSGTSMAAPFVVGVLALYISTLGRRATPEEVLAALQETSKDAGQEGKDNEYGWGLIDPHKLVTYRALHRDGVTLYTPEKE